MCEKQLVPCLATLGGIAGVGGQQPPTKTKQLLRAELGL